MKCRHLIYIFIFSLLTIQLTGCGADSKDTEPRTYTHFCFDTVCQITIYSSYSKNESDIVNTCFEMCDKYDNLFNKHNKKSELYKINSHKSEYIEVSSDTMEIIHDSIYYSDLSGGAFDITISPLTDLWDINNNPHIPNEKEINNDLKYVNYKDILIKDNAVGLSRKQQSMDLGGIAKGYVADRLKTYLKEKKISSAIINLGGNILTIGDNNNQDFVIGIKKPFGERDTDYSAKIKIKDKSVVTSGVYERYFKENNKLYHHILNPETGYPVDNNLYSVTIISKKSEEGDALSTAVFVMGLEKGLSLINSMDDTYAVFITDDYKIHLSDGLRMNENNEITCF